MSLQERMNQVNTYVYTKPELEDMDMVRIPLATQYSFDINTDASNSYRINLSSLDEALQT